MTKKEYTIIEKSKSLFPARELVQSKDGEVTFSVFGPNYFPVNLKEMHNTYSHPITGEKMTFRVPTISKSIELASYDFENFIKPKIFDPKWEWLQAGKYVKTSEGVYTNTHETDEKVLTNLLNNAEKINGIYFIDDKIAFIPYDSFKEGILEVGEFVEQGLARGLEHTTKKKAEKLERIASKENYPERVNVDGWKYPNPGGIIFEKICRFTSNPYDSHENQLMVDGWANDVAEKDGWIFGVLDNDKRIYTMINSPGLPVKEYEGLVQSQDGKITFSVFFRNNPSSEKIKEMNKTYFHPITGEKTTFREPIISESIELASYDFENFIKPKIFDPTGLQAGRHINTLEGVYTNTHETDEEVLTKLLNSAEKVNGIYFIDDKIAFIPYDSFKQGILEVGEFVEQGLARGLEHTTKKKAEKLEKIASKYPRGVKVGGWDPVDFSDYRYRTAYWPHNVQRILKLCSVDVESIHNVCGMSKKGLGVFGDASKKQLTLYEEAFFGILDKKSSKKSNKGDLRFQNNYIQIK